MNESVELYNTLQRWGEIIPSYLGVEATPIALEIGYLTLEDVPELACDFIEEQTRDQDRELVPSYLAFTKRFKEPKPPKKLTKTEISDLASTKHFDEPEHRDWWIDLRRKKELEYFPIRMQRFQEDHDEWEGFIVRFEKTKESYIKYLEEQVPAIKDFLQKRIPVFIPQKDLKLHSYITGGTGSGKSEMMKLLIHRLLVTQPNSSLILVDPHGDVAKEVVRFQEFENNDRLIYFNPTLASHQGLYPTLNPLHVVNPTEDRVDLISQSLIKVFENILEGDTTLTSQMTTILKPCLEVLMLLGNCDLKSVQEFMKDEDNEFFVQAGLSSSNPIHRDFFKNAFSKDGYKTSKHGVYTKLLSLLNYRYFRASMLGEDTINLEQAIENGKVIVFNLSSGTLGSEATEALGRFIVSRLNSFALARANQPVESRLPIYMFIDECQMLLSSSIGEILTGTRKYGLHLSMAQQTLGEGMSNRLKHNVLTNADMKITGTNNASPTYKAVSGDTGVSMVQLQRLNKHQFYVTIRGGLKLPVWGHSSLVGDKNSMSSEAWDRVVQDQIERYYSPMEGTQTVPVEGEGTRFEDEGMVDTPQEPKPKISPPRGGFKFEVDEL